LREKIEELLAREILIALRVLIVVEGAEGVINTIAIVTVVSRSIPCTTTTTSTTKQEQALAGYLAFEFAFVLLLK